MRFSKVYLEISNLCNLSCAFCPGTKRTKKALTEAEFSCLIIIYLKLRILNSNNLFYCLVFNTCYG